MTLFYSASSVLFVSLLEYLSESFFSFLLCKLNLLKSSNYRLLLNSLKGQSFSRLLGSVGITARVGESGKVVRVMAAKPNLSNFNFFSFFFLTPAVIAVHLLAIMMRSK